MTLNQYVYFALSSARTTGREMADVLGIEPDEVTVRAARRAEPPVPVCHSWKIVCRAPGLAVDDQAARVLGRLMPHTGRIAELARELDLEGQEPSAVLSVVRYFHDEDDARSGAADSGLLGWHLDREVLGFLSATGAVLDVDEYDLSPDAEP